MCASPHIITWTPEIGVWERSHAMTHAAPRRKVNGEAAIRPMRKGIKSSWRPTLLAASSSSGSGRLAGGFVSAWLSRGVRSRNPLPMSRRFSQGLLAFRKSNAPALSPGVRTPSAPSPPLVEGVVVSVRTNFDAVVFPAFDFAATDLARGLISTGLSDGTDTGGKLRQLHRSQNEGKGILT